MEEKGLLVVVSGPAGSGKGTVLAELLKDDRYRFSVSATTRSPRPGEKEGVNYYYITKEEFLARLSRGEILEHNEYCGNYYGTPKKEVEEVLASGKNLLLDIDIHGGLNLKKIYPEAVLVMLLPPTYAEQEKRLRGRGTETEEKILERLSESKNELAVLPQYDYVVYNYDGKIAEAAENIRAIVRAEGRNVKRNQDAAEKFFH